MIIKDINIKNQKLTMTHSIFIMCFELIDPVEVMVRRADFGRGSTSLRLEGNEKLLSNEA
jgi:hypothetical protein